MQRLAHLVMLLVLLLSGPALPAWAMPCCTGLATKTAVEPAPRADAMAAMPSCHHATEQKARQDAICMSHCAHGTCILQQTTTAPSSPAVVFSADTATTPTLIESRLPSLSTRITASPQLLRPPSPPTAMPLPLRV